MTTYNKIKELDDWLKINDDWELDSQIKCFDNKVIHKVYVYKQVPQIQVNVYIGITSFYSLSDTHGICGKYYSIDSIENLNKTIIEILRNESIRLVKCFNSLTRKADSYIKVIKENFNLSI